MGFLVLPHPLTNFEIQKYYKSEPRFNGVFSRNDLAKKIKDGTYIINLDEFADVGTHWIALFCIKMKLFISIVLVLNIFLNKLKNLSEIKKIKANIFRLQENNSVMYGYFCIGFIDFMVAGKKLTDYKNLFSPYNFK